MHKLYQHHAVSMLITLIYMYTIEQNVYIQVFIDTTIIYLIL